METTNLSKIKREKMLKTINDIKKNISDEETLNNLSLIENELTKKKYGLIWEEHEERVDRELKTKVPTFTELKNKKLVSSPDNKFNFILEGDNLHCLYLLEKTHTEKIDVIYIDPPYNRGTNDFIYDDKYLGEEDEFRHSKWLSFMSKRLKIAKKLLKNSGCIFISIDDIEYTPLKLLCDEIFGEKFVETYIWCLQDKSECSFVKTSGLTVRKEHEYIIACFKSKKRFNKYRGLREFNDESFSNPDNDPRGDWFSGNISRNGIKTTTGSKYYEIVTPTGKKYTRNWTLSKEEYNEKLENNEIYFSKNGDGVPRLKIYRNSNIYLIQSSLFTDCHTSITGKNELKKLFSGSSPFDFPKPPSLIKRLIEISSGDDAIILDFFAGSGTTGQAVIELNNTLRGNRQFILCTNNENNICEKITYKRLQKIHLGTDKYEKIPFNLKYYKCTCVPRINSEKNNLHDNLLKNIINLIQLENGMEIDGKKIRIYLNEDDLDKFTMNDSELNICEKVYISSDILLTLNQEEKFEENNIEVYIIPEYYFEKEIMEVM